MRLEKFKITLFVAMAIAVVSIDGFAQQKDIPKKTIVVFKTHFDIGYTHLASEAIEMYRTTMIDAALNAIDAMPEGQKFPWTISGWPLAQMLWKGQDAKRLERIEGAIKKDFIKWHALPVTTHTESLDMESLVRGYRFSSEISRKYAKPLSISSKMSDIPQHSWFVPTLLANAGIKFFHIGTNNQCIPPDVPDFFFWEGPDGSRVLVFISKQSYGSGVFPPKNWPFKTWLAFQVTGDNAGPPSNKSVEKLIGKIRENTPETQLVLGTMDDFYNEISKEDLSDLPVVRGDMPDTWIHGLGSKPAETALAKKVRPQIGAWETLNTILDIYGVSPQSDKAKVADAYENSLMFGEHTWGSQTEGIPDHFWGDTLANTIKEYKANKAEGIKIPLVKPGIAYFEESFDQHRRYIWEAKKITDKGLADNMSILSKNVKGKGKRVIVYNPLPWKRDAVVDVDGYTFLAKDMPACGYKTYAMPDIKSNNEKIKDVVENNYFKVTLSPEKGGVISIVDKKSGRELIEKGGVMGQYLFEQFSAAEVFEFIGEYDKNNHVGYGIGRERGVYKGAPITREAINSSGQQMGKPHMPEHIKYSANYAARGKIERIESNNVGQLVEMSFPPTGKNPDGVKLRVQLYAQLPYIDFEWEIKNKTPNRIPEGGWLCFPLNLNNPSWKLGRLGAVIDPAKDIIKDNNFEIFCLQAGLEARDESGYGIAICPMSSPLVSLGKPGLWKFSETWSEREPRIFINLFNNMWNTNFPLWVEGSWTSTVRLWTLTPESTEWDVTGKSIEAMTDCSAVITDSKEGTLPEEQSAVNISREGVVLTAFGKKPDGEGTILRVWEQAGKSGNCEIALPEMNKFKTAVAVDLRGTKLGESIKIINNKFNFELTKYAPRSFILQ